MNSMLRCELLQTEHGFTVICGGRFADRLCRDEALGVIAGALYSGAANAPYLKTYEQWDWFERKYARAERPAVAGLLTFRRTS